MAGEDGEGAAGAAANKEADEKDLELDLMAEQELLRLTRQYRVRNSPAWNQCRSVLYDHIWNLT